MSKRNGQAEHTRNKEGSATRGGNPRRPQDGKASRAVVARWGNREFADVLDPYRASAREKFVARLRRGVGDR